MINNFELIKHLLSFESEDEFYFLQILKRKKEHPNIGRNSIDIKTYYISSIDKLNLVMSEIKCLCEFHNARAYINLNKRSYEKLAFHMLEKMSHCMINRDYKAIRKSYNSVCGTYSTGDKFWVIDIDVLDFDNVLTIAEHINSCQSGFDPNVIAFIPTINGWHIITHPFNIAQIEPYKCEHPFDVQKNNPTLLYYNND